MLAKREPNVEERILQSAKRLFFDRGVSRTPLRAIAMDVGTSESGILRFFHDKHDLVGAVAGLCWDEVYDYIVEALRARHVCSHDPRVELLEVIQAVLEHAEANRATVSFLVDHFHYRVAAGLDTAALARHEARWDGYTQYRRMIEQLCMRILNENPGLRAAGITYLGLCNLTLCLIYGASGGWRLSEANPLVHGEKVPIEDILAVLRKVIYKNGPSTDDATDRRC